MSIEVTQKAISVKQPWALLIARGLKDIENRKWRTNYRGKVLIHAPASASFLHLKEGLTDEQFTQVLKNPYLFSGTTSSRFYEKSAIIGEVEIVDCVVNHSSIWAEKHCWNWVLANAKHYDRPIENVKGALSFWNFTTITLTEEDLNNE